MNKRLIYLCILYFCIGLFIISCGLPDNTKGVDNIVTYHHDKVHSVSCWTGIQSISCLPDSQVKNTGE